MRQATRFFALSPTDCKRSLPPGSTAARLGGDEFVALVPFRNDREALTSLIKQVMAAVRRPIPWNRGHVEVDATIGVAFAKPGDTDPDALLHAADVAMYHGKRAGRGTFRFFHAEMDVALKARARMETDLRAAITRGEIRPFYQPIVALPAQDLVGFEVLARWDSPEHGAGAAGRLHSGGRRDGNDRRPFVTASCGRPAPTREAGRSICKWRSIFLPCSSATRDCPPRCSASSPRAAFAPGRLEVEITESALIKDVDAAHAALESLQNLGVKVALDDFGTGYSSLQHLRELRFNKIKIDRSYITNLEQGSERAKLVDAIIQIGASLSLQTTAEESKTTPISIGSRAKAATSARATCSGARCRRTTPTASFASAKRRSRRPAAHAA